VVLVLLGVALIAPLIVASRLTPNAAGMGTHQQLGLPPCTIVMFWGMRCPSCGMTTSWALATHGRLLAAAQANAGGLLLALIAVVMGPWSLVSGLRGYWIGGPPSDRLLAGSAILVVVVTLLDWAARIWT
jgi:hypothetical protein